MLESEPLDYLLQLAPLKVLSEAWDIFFHRSRSAPLDLTEFIWAEDVASLGPRTLR